MKPQTAPRLRHSKQHHLDLSCLNNSYKAIQLVVHPGPNCHLRRSDDTYYKADRLQCFSCWYCNGLNTSIATHHGAEYLINLRILHTLRQVQRAFVSVTVGAQFDIQHISSTMTETSAA